MLHRDRWSPFSTPAADETADTTSQPVDASSSRTLHTPARHRPRFFDSLLGVDLVVMTRLLFVRFAMSSTARTGGTMGIGASEPGLSPIFPARSSCTSPASLAGDAAFGCRASAGPPRPAVPPRRPSAFRRRNWRSATPGALSGRQRPTPTVMTDRGLETGARPSAVDGQPVRMVLPTGN